jgi:mRNA interferase MazF
MGSKENNPLQGEIWLLNPDAVKGAESDGKVRPALIVSINMMNEGTSGLVIVVPLTSKDKRIPSHICIDPLGGMDQTGYAMCEQVRAVTKGRLIKRIGQIESKQTLEEVLLWLTDLLWMDMSTTW